MNINRKRVVIWLFGLLTVMFIIFLFSSQNSTNSGKTSKTFLQLFKQFNSFEYILDKLPTSLGSDDNKLRKIAHFSLYCVLGFFSYFFVSIFYVKKYDVFIFFEKIFISFFICLIYAIFDEFHQTLVDGRGGQILDVFIDSLGFSFMILLLSTIELIFKIIRHFILFILNIFRYK